MESLSGFKVNPEAGDVDVVDAKPAAVPSPTSTTYHVSSNDDYAKVEKRPSNKKAKCKWNFISIFLFCFFTHVSVSFSKVCAGFIKFYIKFYQYRLFLFIFKF